MPRSSSFGFSVVFSVILATLAPVSRADSKAEINLTAPKVVEGYLQLGFDRLGEFAFNPIPYDPAKPDQPPPSSADQIPAAVKKYNDQKAVVTGFMLPTKTAKGLVTEFLLLKDPSMCCYGVIPSMNQWVIVRMPNGVPAVQDVPLSFYGRLHVREIFDNGYLSGIYLLDGEKMAPKA